MNPRQGAFFETSAGGEKVRAFIPPALPPVPPLNLSARHFDLIEKANSRDGFRDPAEARDR